MDAPAIFARDEGEMRVVDLDGLVALYHVRSGMTHLIAEPVPQILAALLDGPCDPATLEARLAARFDLEGEDGSATLRAHLEELEALGLVRRHLPPQGRAAA